MGQLLVWRLCCPLESVIIRTRQKKKKIMNKDVSGSKRNVIFSTWLKWLHIPNTHTTQMWQVPLKKSLLKSVIGLQWRLGKTITSQLHRPAEHLEHQGKSTDICCGPSSRVRLRTLESIEDQRLLGSFMIPLLFLLYYCELCVWALHEFCSFVFASLLFFWFWKFAVVLVGWLKMGLQNQTMEYNEAGTVSLRVWALVSLRAAVKRHCFHKLQPSSKRR